MEIKRGDIFYVLPKETIGSEQVAGRPAIVVSNDKGNFFSEVVEVVYLTTAVKTLLPTHVSVFTASRPSTALCEQVHTVSKERLGDRFGRCTLNELNAVDSALRISLGLDDYAVCDKDLSRITSERDIYKALYEQLLSKITG